MCCPREANIHGPTELFTRRPFERGPSRERGEVQMPQILRARQVSPSMHRLCDVMLGMAPRVLSETGI